MPRNQLSIRKEWGLRFNGSTQSVTFGAVGTLGNIKVASPTWSIWFKFARAPSADTGLMHYGSNGVNLWISTDGKINYSVISVAPVEVRVTTKKSYADGAWHQATATYDGANAKIYIDGILDNTAAGAITVDYATGTAFRVGAFSGGTGLFNGSLKDARIYGSAFTANQAADLFAQGPNIAFGTPVLFLKMDEGTGTSVADSSSSGYTGTIVGRTVGGAVTAFSLMWAIDPVRPRRRVLTDAVSSIYFNGTSSKVSIPDNSALNITTGDFTFEYKIFVNRYSVQILFSKRNDVSFVGYESYLDNSVGSMARNTFTASFDDGEYAIVGSNVPVSKGKWYHVICSATRATQENFRLFVNGVYDVGYVNETLYSDTASTITNAVALEFMDRNSVGFAQGGMYDVRLYNRALTDDECLARYYMEENITSGRVGWWKMNETTGTSIADSQGSNTGTLTAGTFLNNTMS